MKTTPKKNSSKRRLEWVAGIFFIAIVGFFIFVTIESRNENTKLLKEGIRTTATINSLDISGTRKSKNYSMRVSMFTEGESRLIVSDTTGKSTATKDIDSILNKALSKVKSIGEYQNITISITNTTYSKYKVGDKVEVVYLKTDPQNVKLVEEIDGL